MRTVHYLPWVMLIALGVLALALWAANAGLAPPAAPARMEHARQKTPVSPRQLDASNGIQHPSAADVQAMAHDGRTLAWRDLSAGRPVVLIFIKDGCPCSAEFEPYFQRVAKLYAAEVSIAGVIDADAAAARRYAAAQQVNYPILVDGERAITRRFAVENGGYFMLLNAAGGVEGYWPGCSPDTLRDLGRRIAEVANVRERPLDTTGMPGRLITGCPYES